MVRSFALKTSLLVAGILCGVPAHAVKFDYFEYEVRWDKCPQYEHDAKIWWAPTGNGEVRFIVCEWITVSDDPNQPVGTVRHRWKK